MPSYTPEQDGLIERFFPSLKEECAWLQNFAHFGTRERQFASGLSVERGPHQALGNLSARENRA